MRSEIRSYPRPNGERQRIQLVRLDSWEELEFFFPGNAQGATRKFAEVYRNYLLPAAPWLFGRMLLFSLPEGGFPLPMNSARWGELADEETAAAVLLRESCSLTREGARLRTRTAQELYELLHSTGLAERADGALPFSRYYPVTDCAGYLSENEPDALLKVNSSFFTMDPFDCSSVYDRIGVPIGLMVKDGTILNPPLYEREALLVDRDGTVRIAEPKLTELKLLIHGALLQPGGNAKLYQRPQHAKTPPTEGTDIVIIGTRVAAVHHGGRTQVPGGGFVLQVSGKTAIRAGERVEYLGMENVRFGIQVGNSILRDGVRTAGFRSRFYQIRRLEPTPYPPSLYPMDFQNAKAARIALGADAQGKPMLLWAEGAGKLHYVPGDDSCGASLAQLGELCADVGMVQAVNLDGGGSAQILLNNERQLRISDRNKEDNSEAERAVPAGLIIRRKTE